MADTQGRRILSAVHHFADKKDYPPLAKQLKRTLQLWGHFVSECQDPLTVDDEDLLEIFWRSVFGTIDLNDKQLRICALRFYGSVEGTARTRFAPLVEAMEPQRKQIVIVASKLIHVAARPDRLLPLLPRTADSSPALRRKAFKLVTSTGV